MSPRSSDIVGGRVSDVPFARVFGALALRQLTGVLRLEQDGRRYALYFQDGAIADADSSAPEDTLGRVSLEANLVPPGAVGESVRRMAQDSSKSQRDIFIEMGALKGETLERALRLTLTRRTLRIFSLPTANFAVDELHHGRLEGGPVEPRWSLYRGLRLHYDERRLDLEMIGALAGQAFRLTADPQELQQPFGFSNDERIVLNYLQRATANGFFWELGDLVDACISLPRASVLAVVHALHAFENLELRAASTVNRLRKPPREPTQQLERQTLEIKGPPTTPPGQAPGNVRFTPPTGAPIDPLRSSGQFDPSRTEPHTPIESLWMPRATGTNPPVPPFTSADPSSGSNVPVRPRPTSPFPAQPRTPTIPPAATRPISGPATVIGPPSRGSSPSQPMPASKRSSGPTAPFGHGLRPVTDPGTGTRATNPNLGRDQQINAKLADIERDSDHFILLEVDRSSTLQQIKDAFFALAKQYHPDRSKNPAEKTQLERIQRSLNAAYADLSDDQKRNDYLRILAQGGRQAIKKKNDEEQAKANKILIAEEHFKRGEMAMRRQQFALALEEFQDAVENNELQAEYFAGLAYSRWCNASDRSSVHAEVMNDLKKAVKLNNRCVEAFFYRGLVYKETNEPDKAHAYFKKVLDLNPDHVESAREVRLIEMRKKSGGKGLFDRFRKK